MIVASRSRSRLMLAANTRNTSSWVTPSPSSTPASVSVTSAISRVAQRQLPGQDGLRMPGHPDQRPALRGIPAGLGPGGETGAFDDHQRSRRHRLPARRLRRADRGGPADRAVRVSELDVHGAALVVERLGPACGPVDQLVGHGQGAGAVGRGQRADRARAPGPGGRRPSAAPRGWPGTGSCAGGTGDRGHGAAGTRRGCPPISPMTRGSLGGPNGVSTVTSSAESREPRRKPGNRR